MFPECFCQNGVDFFRRLAFQEKKTWQLESRCCLNCASPDMLPFSLCNKINLANRHMNRPLFPKTQSIPSYDIGKSHVKVRVAGNSLDGFSKVYIGRRRSRDVHFRGLGWHHAAESLFPQVKYFPSWSRSSLQSMESEDLYGFRNKPSFFSILSQFLEGLF